jgi:hypothetical protein
MEQILVPILLVVFVVLFIRSTRKSKAPTTPVIGGGGYGGDETGDEKGDVVLPKTDSPTNQQ